MTEKTPRENTAALLMGYGSPNGAEDLPEYLTDVLHGKRPSEEMVAEYVQAESDRQQSAIDRILQSRS